MNSALSALDGGEKRTLTEGSREESLSGILSDDPDLFCPLESDLC